MSGVRRLRGSHSADNIAALFIDLVMEYDIVDLLGLFISDNASVNDKVVEIVLDILRPDIKNPKDRRIRYICHIINLVVRAFMQGFISKLHNVIQFIRKTPQRREEFKRLIRDAD